MLDDGNPMYYTRPSMPPGAEALRYVAGHALGMIAAQKGAASLFVEGRAVDPDSKGGQLHAADAVFGEEIHVPRQLEARPGGFIGIVIVVARRDEHRRAHPGEAAAELLPGLEIAVVAVQQVARQQHKLHLLLPRKLGQPGQQRTLLLPSEGGLACRQPLEGGVEVQVGRVQNPNLAHFSLTPSALRQRPVSLSISKTQPSSLLGPLADS